MKTKKINGKQYVAIDAVSEHEISGNLIESKKHKLWLDLEQLAIVFGELPIKATVRGKDIAFGLNRPGNNPEATS